MARAKLKKASRIAAEARQSQTGERSGVIRPIQQREGDGTASSSAGDRGSQPGKGGGSGKGGGGGGGRKKGYDKDQQSQTGERSGVIRPVQQREGDGTASSSAFLGRTRDRHEDDVESPPF